MRKLEIDHIVLVVPDLKKAVSFFKNSLGIEPIFGGKHAGVGTHNALLRLGPLENLTYLELFAIDPEDDTPYEFYPMGISKEVTHMYVGGWCIRCSPQTDIADINQSMKALGKQYDLGDIKKMHRLMPSSAILSWQLASTLTQVIISRGQIPFLIKWDDLSLHPALQLPRDVFVSYSLNFEGPTSTSIEKDLLQLGFLPVNHIKFIDSSNVSITLMLQSKKNAITFTGLTS